MRELGRVVKPGGSRMSTFEDLLFENGRPILLAPPTAPTHIGRNRQIDRLGCKSGHSLGSGSPNFRTQTLPSATISGISEQRIAIRGFHFAESAAWIGGCGTLRTGFRCEYRYEECRKRCATEVAGENCRSCSLQKVHKPLPAHANGVHHSGDGPAARRRRNFLVLCEQVIVLRQRIELTFRHHMHNLVAIGL